MPLPRIDRLSPRYHAAAFPFLLRARELRSRGGGWVEVSRLRDAYAAQSHWSRHLDREIVRVFRDGSW